VKETTLPVRLFRLARLLFLLAEGALTVTVVLPGGGGGGPPPTALSRDGRAGCCGFFTSSCERPGCPPPASRPVR
jgi:hypothetical protein